MTPFVRDWPEAKFVVCMTVALALQSCAPETPKTETPTSAKPRLVVEFPDDHASAVAIDSTGTRITYLVGWSRLEQIDRGTGRKSVLHDFHPRHSHVGNTSNIATDPTGHWVGGAGNDTLVLVEQPSGRLIRTLKSPGSDLLDIAPSPSGDRIAAQGQGFQGIVIWDVQSGRVVRRLEDERTEWSFALAWSPAGELLAQGGGDGPDARVILWDVRRNRVVGRLAGGLSPVHGLAFAPNGELLVARYRDTLMGWKVSSGEKLWEVSQPKESPFGSVICFLAEGELFVIGAKGQGHTLKMLDSSTGQMVGEWVAHDKFILDLDCCPDHALVVSAENGGGLRLWDLSEMVQSH